MKFMVRAFIPNPGGAYDPPPLEQFDLDKDKSNGFIPSIGDVIQWDDTKPAYLVIDRFFNFFTRVLCFPWWLRLCCRGN